MVSVTDERLLITVEKFEIAVAIELMVLILDIWVICSIIAALSIGLDIS